jgi:type 1 glutamine amidotransferase
MSGPHPLSSGFFKVRTLLYGCCVVLSTWLANAAMCQDLLTYEGGEGVGQGKHIVFIAAEESYRSELSMPLMARILSRQGFKCTVLFAIDPDTGTIDPRVKDNLPGLETLASADLMVAFLRWRELPDDQMKHLIDYTESGRPILGIRNATHPFRYAQRKDRSPFARYDSSSQDPPGGWGRAVLGETWVSHYGANLVESTRCDAVPQEVNHPIFQGVNRSFWLPDDVYGISDSLEGECRPLMLGQPLSNWLPTGEPVVDKPAIPIAWTRYYETASGKKARVFTSTMGHGDAFKVEDFRRLLANACFWCLEMEDQIDPHADMSLSGNYLPGPVGAPGLELGRKPSDPVFAKIEKSREQSPPIRALIDDEGPGWRALVEQDFQHVNSAEETWSWKEGTLYCTGQPVSVLRTEKPYKNFELVVEWMHEKEAGNSGVFVWVTPESIERLTQAGKPGLPDGIEIQILDHGYTDKIKSQGKATDWFGTNGDVFAVRVQMKPFPPLSPNGSRSFPRRHLANGHGEWNHYYIRAINGEVRLWVNGEEVSGGTECNPAEGFLCLESEGSAIQFRKIRLRELP